MRKLKACLKDKIKKAREYFLGRQPQFLFLLLLAVFLFYLKQTAYFAGILSVQLITFILWLIAALTLKFDTKVSFIPALLFLSLCPILIIINIFGWTPERAAEYAYGFLLFGVIQELWSLRLRKS